MSDLVPWASDPLYSILFCHSLSPFSEAELAVVWKKKQHNDLQQFLWQGLWFSKQSRQIKHGTSY